MKVRKALGVVAVFACIACVLAITRPIAGCAAEAIVLKAVTVFDPGRETVIGMSIFANKVNKRAKGEMRIDIIGGPEVIPIPEQPKALMNGTIDVLLTFSATFEDQVPQCIPLSVSEMTPQEERENGFYDWLNEKMQKANMYYVCRAHFNYGFYTYTNKPVKERRDFAGQKFGVTPLWIPFASKLGCVPVLMQEPDLYTGLSRGVIDGYMLPPDSVTALGLAEITKYTIGPKFYRASNVLIMINLDKWNRLPKHLREIIKECGKEVEVKIGEYYKVWQAKLQKQILDSGVKYIPLSPEDEKWYLNLASQALWDKAKEKNSAEDYAKLRNFLLK